MAANPEVNEGILRPLAALTLLLLLGTAAPGLQAGKKTPEKFGVVVGTVFQKTGFSLPGANITLTPVVEEGAKVNKKEIQRTTSDRRGEFAFRVPCGSLGYTVRVEADGWQTAKNPSKANGIRRLT